MANLRSTLLHRLAGLTSRAEDELRQCIDTDQELREIFVDYRRCHEMLREWRVSLKTDQNRVKDFEELSQELEKEMADLLRERRPADVARREEQEK
jgi:hypothetical protein